jgi:hypothetical protein
LLALSTLVQQRQVLCYPNSESQSLIVVGGWSKAQLTQFIAKAVPFASAADRQKFESHLQLHSAGAKPLSELHSMFQTAVDFGMFVGLK